MNRSGVKQVLCYYNGKVVDMASYVADPKKRFNLAAMRIIDNGYEGYVVEGDKLYFVGKNSRTSKLVRDPVEAADVMAEIAAIQETQGA